MVVCFVVNDLDLHSFSSVVYLEVNLICELFELDRFLFTYSAYDWAVRHRGLYGVRCLIAFVECEVLGLHGLFEVLQAVERELGLFLEVQGSVTGVRLFRVVGHLKFTCRDQVILLIKQRLDVRTLYSFVIQLVLQDGFPQLQLCLVELSVDGV